MIVTTTTPNAMKEGDVLTIKGICKPDKRLWPRLRNWVLRRPPPMTKELVRWKVTNAGCVSVMVEREE
ncbi:MAG: hypothetical protein RL758_188 [Pseudomonadota bacterium]|jgi:hypothetical protein